MVLYYLWITNTARMCQNRSKGYIVRHFFVINPAAGKGKRVDELAAQIKSVCERREEKYEIYYTAGVGDAKKYVNNTCRLYEASGEILRFYACGGDGTINEVANGIVGFENAELAVIPIGTGNDFVRNFSWGEGFFDIDAQLDGETRKIDIMKYNNRYAINVINIGFDCEVAAQAAEWNPGIHGWDSPPAPSGCHPEPACSPLLAVRGHSVNKKI